MSDNIHSWSLVVNRALGDLPDHVDERNAELNAWVAIIPAEVPERIKVVELADSLNRHVLLQRELPFTGNHQ